MTVRGGGAETGAAGGASRATVDWKVLSRQVGGLMRLELRRLLLSHRVILLGLAASVPVLIVLFVALLPIDGQSVLERFGNRSVYGNIYQTVFLRAVVFFGCLYVFFNLFRGEMLDRSLHYSLLTPMRREIIVVGKYAAGVVAMAALFVASTLASYLLIYLPVGFAGAMEDIAAGPGGGHLVAYVSVTVLASIGYGALFMLIGILFRNPIIPAGILFLWEGIHFLLPAALKRLSVVHYLKGMLPVPISEGPFAVVVEPPPAIVSVLGLLALTMGVLALASLIARRMEIRYTED